MRARHLSPLSVILLMLCALPSMSGPGGTPGASDPARESTFIKSPDKAVRVLVIESLSGRTSVGAALDALGTAYDTYLGDAWSTLNLSTYNQIFLALEGGSPQDADVLAMRNFAAAGGAVHLLGGTSISSFTTALNAYLIGIDLAATSWTVNPGSPEVLTVDPLSYLARGLTSPFDRVGQAYYNLRITDPAAHVVATNSDGRTVLATKKIGAGRFDIDIYSPNPSYNSDPNDRAQLFRVVANMLGGPATLPPALVLGNGTTAVTDALTSLGVAWDLAGDANWAAMDLSPYRDVFVGNNGTTTSQANLQALANYAAAGGTLTYFGGCGNAAFTNAFNATLMLVDTANWTWTMAAGAPHVTNLQPGSRLGFRLPATYNFNESGLTFYQLRVTDPVATVVARNAVGIPVLATRERGAGTITYAAGPLNFYYYPHDLAWLRQLVANMVNMDAPAITSIADIPNDQGGAVRLKWRSVWQDAAMSPTPIASYSVWRRAGVGTSKGLPGGTWDFVASVPAQRLASYQAVVPTMADSTAAGVRRSVFAVSAVATSGSTFFYSLADSGCSVDNLAPNVPAAFARLNVSTLGWGDPVDADFRYFTVYGSNSGVFDGTAVVVGHSISRTQNVSGLGWHWYYLTATDYAGNESGAASLNGLSAVPGALPSAFALHGATPNPFNPRTELRFDLPVPSRVTLSVYDVSGRLVRTLVADEQLEAGSQARAWDGRDDAGRSLPAGAYLYRLRAGEFTQTRTMMLVK